MAANCTLSALASTNRLISFQNISRTQTMNGALSMKNERFGTLFKIFWPATPPAAAQNGNFPLKTLKQIGAHLSKIQKSISISCKYFLNEFLRNKKKRKINF